jgi:SAM-dependent methyltransferase
VTDETGYLLDNRQVEAGQRFEALSRLLDPWTFRHFDVLGIQPGWRCWEVGAGSPSVPSELARRVGDAGYVLATDIDTRWMSTVDDPVMDVQRHDIASQHAPADGFDLVHARLLLVHVPERQRALTAMVDALRPGGRLLLEEADPYLQPLVCLDEHGPEQRLANKLKRDFRELMSGRGVDLAYGRTLPRRLREAGLVDVQADAYFPVTSPDCALLEKASVEQIRTSLIEAGLATEPEIKRHLDNVASGSLDLTIAPLISASGRKPD